MIRPEHEGPIGAGQAPPAATDAAAQDFWAYVQDERERYPHLWRVVVRVHAHAFRLAYPDIPIGEVWKLGDVILRDAITAIEALNGTTPENSSNRFRLQMPIFPVGRQTPDFEGTWRGWLTIGRPERVY